MDAHPIAPMRLRLAHTLSLLLMSAVLLAVLFMGTLMAWSLRNGFADYLAARDTHRLEQFTALVAEHIEAAGSIEALHEQHFGMRELLHAFALRQGLSPRSLPGDGARPKGPPDPFGRRVALYDLQGHAILGRPLPEGAQGWVERPVRVHGQVLAFARMLPLPEAADEGSWAFLKTQYKRIAYGALVLLALACLMAWWVARRWVAPLLAVRKATHQIAKGQLRVRLPQQGIGEIGDVVSNINQMAEGLQRLEGARRRWIADISHELRTPLTVLRGEIEALRDGVRPTGPSAIASLHDEVMRLGQLIEDLHLLALSDLQALPCRMAPTQPHELLDQVMRRFATRAQQRGLGITLAPQASVASHTPLLAQWDAARIEQLLSNLLENSMRYTDAPGRVQLGLKRVGSCVEIDIDDTAPSVPRADLPRLFEPLYRADAARSRHQGGSGLGLAICEAIVKAHRGRIAAVESELGGLRVHIELPLAHP